MTYDINFKEKGEIKLHVRKFLLYPKFWSDPSNAMSTSAKWKRVKFRKSSKIKVPVTKGIYCFVVKPAYIGLFETRYLFYVGQTTRTLQKRFNDYLNDQEGKGKPRPKIFEMLTLYKSCLYFYYSSITDSKLIDKVEGNLLNTFVPHINTDIPKAKIKPELHKIYE